tara:strand:+ start:141 stop:557 length:417 start_codon:yes stop_codon:yes gene_type:complete
MGLIKIVKKISSGSYDNFYVGTDIKSIVGTTSGSANNTQVSTIVLETVSGVVATIVLTPGVQTADLAKIVSNYFWERAIIADSAGSDFAGLVGAAQMGSSANTGVVGGAGVGEYFLLDSSGDPDTTTTLVTIDSVTIT